MTQARIFPFRRVSVDHMVRGVTRVWWQLEPLFNDPGPYIFQLQFGRTGLRDAADWQNVGEPVTDGYVALDPAWREASYDLLVHYRITLTTPLGTYVSQAAACSGELTEKDWLLAREIIRKEKLRHKLVSVPGYLIKQMRYGVPCKRCRDPLTSEITDADCPVCNGTSFEIGYHPPLPMQCWDLSPQTIVEQVDSQMKGATRDNPYVNARVIGFPALNKNDIWVNGSSDERWLVEQIQIVAAIRNVPIVYQVQLGLLPFHSTVYKLEVGGEVPERDGPVLPVLGCGAVTVDQDYLGPDSLIYAPEAGCPIVGAKVYVFEKTVFDPQGVAIDRALAVANTYTRVNGRWAQSLNLDPGNYTLLYEKLGDYGPDTVELVVTPPVTPQAAPAWTPETQIPLQSTPSLNTQTTPSGTVKKKENDFWNI